MNSWKLLRVTSALTAETDPVKAQTQDLSAFGTLGRLSRGGEFGKEAQTSAPLKVMFTAVFLTADDRIVTGADRGSITLKMFTKRTLPAATGAPQGWTTVLSDYAAVTLGYAEKGIEMDVMPDESFSVFLSAAAAAPGTPAPAAATKIAIYYAEAA